MKCGVCFPPLYPENIDAHFIYCKVANQVKVSAMGDIIGIEHSAIYGAMELYGIEDKVECFEKVLRLHDEMMDYRDNGKEEE